jgi:hypothetical protein
VASHHPAFSSDLVPSDFFLFDALKDQLAGGTFESADGLVKEIREMRSAIPRAKLENSVAGLEREAQRYIDINGVDAGETTT